ncbi:MAG: undecaprenyldiphospho-muramoylpentapeptide beta-N-acetylglucosaminyltransferase [Betaproteobacteria bacterium]
MSTPTLLVMAGGTGGHVMPGLAVAQILREQSWRIVWLGNPEGMEAALVARHGIAFEPVSIKGLRGKGPLALLALPLKLLRAFAQSISALRRVRPSVVLGMGGYVAFPGGMMASLLGYPLVVHEQNSVAGLTNRVLAKLADRVLEAFPGTLTGAIWTGNPVRRDLGALPAPELRYRDREGPLRVLVVGGSLGARVLNEIVPQALALLGEAVRPRVMHQSGRSHGEALREAYRSRGIEAEVADFIEDMTAAYRDADLVICRAGAMTIAELAAAGVASVLVPLPHAVDDHQTSNARYLADRGAATLIAQTDLSAPALADLLRQASRPALMEQAVRARALARTEAAQAVAEICAGYAPEGAR